MDDYQSKIEREQNWHTNHGFQAKHFLNSRVLFSKERNDFNYRFPRKNMGRLFEKALHGIHKPSILIAPIGYGEDLEWLKNTSKGVSGNLSGIDISLDAIKKIDDKSIQTHVGDMKHMDMFSENQFDAVVIPLFFHHFVPRGFGEFLDEVYRVLKPGGILISLEPSSFYPISWITRYGRKLCGEITGLLEDEMPFPPKKLMQAMKASGFDDTYVMAASFSHNRFPILFAMLFNLLTYPFLKMPLFRHFGWLCIFYARKQKVKGNIAA